MSSIRIAVNMQPQGDEHDHVIFRAALPLGVWFEKSLDKQEVETARVELEEKYRALVGTLRAMLPHLKEGNVVDYWMFGNVVTEFELQTANMLVFVDKLSDHLARDVGYSKTMIDLCRRFRKKFSDPALIDPTLSFDAYHRNSFDPQRAAAFERAKPPKRRRGHLRET